MQTKIPHRHNNEHTHLPTNVAKVTEVHASVVHGSYELRVVKKPDFTVVQLPGQLRDNLFATAIMSATSTSIVDTKALTATT